MAKVFSAEAKQSSAATSDPARRQVLDALGSLHDDWSIYDHPIVGFDRPDFVAAHPMFGVCAIVVRNWDVGTRRQTWTGEIEALAGDRWITTADSPRVEANDIRTGVFEQFFADCSADRLDPTVVRAIVVLPRFTTSDACALLRRPPSVDPGNLIKVWGGRALLDDPMCVVTGHPRPQVRMVSPVALDRLHDHCVQQRVAA